MDAKELSALGNGMVHMIRALPHDEQLGLMMALNQAVLSKHARECAGLVVQDMLGWLNQTRQVKAEPEKIDWTPATDPSEIN